MKKKRQTVVKDYAFARYTELFKSVMLLQEVIVKWRIVCGFIGSLLFFVGNTFVSTDYTILSKRKSFLCFYLSDNNIWNNIRAIVIIALVITYILAILKTTKYCKNYRQLLEEI
ncbi:hypothetical protein [Succinivibrio dextrinosolvens]|jgi:hypothetical protein|uniref:hypothetical protein n=1 Tax=Succinivibrio dextrinosolvens TaxID=83771 RepID=UPI00241D37C7|nr:hypothetical protein [Succinivibrio dextrinosolvens]MBE6423125.1 hypothetical protein [Succinivibrio dextrinosolvens]